jgi:hypothetical protein
MRAIVAKQTGTAQTQNFSVSSSIFSMEQCSVCDSYGVQPYVGSCGKHKSRAAAQSTVELVFDVKHFYAALELDEQRQPLSVHRFSGGHFNPSFADAIFAHVSALLSVETNTDVVLKHRSDMMGASGINGETIG